MTHFGSKKEGIFKVKISLIESIKNDLSSSKKVIVLLSKTDSYPVIIYSFFFFIYFEKRMND
jgi:hypothetical protein